MIQIEDNFFDDIEEFFSILGNFDLREKAPEHNWQGARSSWLHTWNEEAYNLALDTMLKKFNVLRDCKFRKVDMSVHLRADKYINPHCDESDYNCLVYLKGQISQFNGTGFYTEVGNECVLNATVGFQPNRAIVFKGNNLHACLNSLGTDIAVDRSRYTLNTFLYKEVN